MSRVERMFGPRESWENRGADPAAAGGDSSSTQSAGEPLEGREEKRAGIRGFVSIKCPQCGKVHTTCLHEARTIFNCRDCGQPVALEGLKSIKMECPRCRFKARYLTNREEKLIQMECLNCSHPVNFRKGFRRGNYVVEVET